MKYVLLVLLAGALVLVATSCEVEFSTFAPPEPTRTLDLDAAAPPAATRAGASEEQEWKRRVNAICARRNARARELSRPRSLDELATYAEDVLRIYRGANHRIDAVPVPKQHTQARARLRRTAAATEGILADLSQAARAGDSARAIALSREVQVGARRSARTFLRLGLTDCLASSAAPL